MDRHEHWESVYATKQDLDTSWFQERPTASLMFIGNAGVPSGGRIVDIGGGTSRLVDCLRNDYRMTVLDISAAALDRAKARLGLAAATIDWVATDVTQWTPPHRFDCWHDRAAFHFLTEEVDRRAYASVMAYAVAPGRQAIVATFAADGPERRSGLPVRRYDANELAAEFAPAFELVEARTHEHLTPGGRGADARAPHPWR